MATQPAVPSFVALSPEEIEEELQNVAAKFDRFADDNDRAFGWVRKTSVADKTKSIDQAEQKLKFVADLHLAIQSETAVCVFDVSAVAVSSIMTDLLKNVS